MRQQKNSRATEFGRTRVRFYGSQKSETSAKVVDPYGGLGRRAAEGAYNQFAGPLLGYFGAAPQFGDGRRGRRREANYNERMAAFEDSPLGAFAAQARDYLPTMFGQASDVGNRIATLAPEIFDMLRGQVGTALEQLPGLQSAAAGQVGQAQQGLGFATRGLNEAYSPIANQALYQNALRGALESAQGGAAARGLLDSGGAQQQQDVLSRDLAAQFADRQFGQQQMALQGQQQALGGVQSALGAQAGLLPLGAQLAGLSGDALQQLIPALQAGYQLPAEALQQVFAQLASFANPTLAVGQLAAPTVTSTSRGSGFNIL